MTLFVAPLGVATALYLTEYARQTQDTKSIRISITNLAGVPAIIYGVFGLGFFVYGLGGQVDELFFADCLPSPTFGTPFIVGSLDACTTTAVVIAAVTEGLMHPPMTCVRPVLHWALPREKPFRAVLPAALPSVLLAILATKSCGRSSTFTTSRRCKFAPRRRSRRERPLLNQSKSLCTSGFNYLMRFCSIEEPET